MDYLKVNNYSETFCSVISQIVQSELKQIKYDKTVKGIIIDDSKSNFNYYTIKEGNINYVAYGVGDIYKKGESVFITIPNGDYEQQKFILGRTYDNNDINFNFLSDVLIASGEKIDLKNNRVGLVANGSDSYANIITWENKLIDLIIDYDYLIFSAKFQTSLSQCRMGTFGMEVILTYLDGKDLQKNKRYLFLNQDMYGDVYSLQGATQKFLLAINKDEIKKILQMEFKLYQQNDFLDSSKKLIDSNGQENISITDLWFDYGYNKATLKTNSIIINADTDITYLNEEDNLGPIKWSFIFYDDNTKNIRRIVDNNSLLDIGYAQKILTYDPKYTEIKNDKIETKQWKILFNDDGTEYYNLENFIINSFNGNMNQKQSGIQIIIYKSDTFEVITKQKIIFYKEEKEENS